MEFFWCYLTDFKRISGIGKYMFRIVNFIVLLLFKLNIVNLVSFYPNLVMLLKQRVTDQWIDPLIYYFVTFLLSF